MTERNEEFVDIGKILGRFHLDNRVKVQPYTNTYEEFIGIKEYYIKTLTGFKKIDLKFEQRAGKYLIYSVHNVKPEVIQLLKGKEIYARYEDLPPAGENEFYVHDLAKCKVFDCEMNFLGNVTNVLEGGGGVYIEFGQYLIPFSERYVQSVDVKELKIVLTKVFSDEKDFLI